MKRFCLKSTGWLLIAILVSIIAVATSAVLKSCAAKKDELPDSTISSENRPHSIEFDNALITKAIIAGIPENSGITDIHAQVYPDDTIGLTCTFSPASLINYCSENGSELSPSAKLMIKLLPDSVNASARFALSLDVEKNLLTLSPRTLSLNGMELDGALLPEELSISVSRGINGFLNNNQRKIESITISEGKILLNLA